MKKTKVISCFLAAILIAASFAGCGDSASASTDETSQKLEQQQTQDQRGIMAKVVALEGDTLTVILADMPTDKGEGGTPPDGQSGATPPAISTDGSGQQGKSGEPRQGGGQIQFTGEQATYTLSDEVKITKGMGDSAVEIDLSEVAADSVISFTTTTDDDGNEVISKMQVME